MSVSTAEWRFSRTSWLLLTLWVFSMTPSHLLVWANANDDGRCDPLKTSIQRLNEASSSRVKKHRKVDRYGSFTQLSKYEIEGEDYRVDIIDRKSRSTVLAIHGGRIEPGTDAIAREIAADNTSYYVFEGINEGESDLLHITSTRFDDPRAISLVESSLYCVSIHSFVEFDRNIACIGGGNRELREWVGKSLERSSMPIQIKYLCPSLEGQSRENIVNRCRKQGVQPERRQVRLTGDLVRYDPKRQRERSSLPGAHERGA